MLRLLERKLDWGRVGDRGYHDGVHLKSWCIPTLHNFANRIGLQREWFQEEGIRFRARGPVVSSDHYDLTTTGAYHRARAACAIYLPIRDLVKAFPIYPRRRGIGYADVRCD